MCIAAVVILVKNFTICLILILLLCASNSVYSMAYQPIEWQSAQILDVYNEICVLLLILIHITFNPDFGAEPAHRNQFGWLFVIIMCLLTLTNIIVVIYLTVYESLKNWLAKRRRIRDALAKE